MTSPLLSIITVCYNPGNDLDETINSVLSQSCQFLEYIIIDGGSKDGTLEKLKKLNDSRVKWLSEKDDGIYDAMNKGIHLAKGKWLNFMNAGDQLEDGILDKISFLDYSMVAILYGNHRKSRTTVIKPKKIEILKYGKIMACHQAMFFNKELLGSEVYYNSKLLLNGDSDLVTRVYLKKYEIKYIDEVVAFYKGGGASNRFILKSKYQKYSRMWRYFGLIGLLRTAFMQKGWVSASEFDLE